MQDGRIFDCVAIIFVLFSIFFDNLHQFHVLDFQQPFVKDNMVIIYVPRIFLLHYIWFWYGYKGMETWNGIGEK